MHDLAPHKVCIIGVSLLFRHKLVLAWQQTSSLAKYGLLHPTVARPLKLDCIKRPKQRLAYSCIVLTAADVTIFYVAYSLSEL